MVLWHVEADLLNSPLKAAPVFLHLFFFQAEDGIRDLTVTGVQTCALPISKVKLNHRIISRFSSALLENRQRLLIVAALVKDPPKGIADGSVLPLQLTGLTRQLVSLVEIIQALGVKISEVI